MTKAAVEFAEIGPEAVKLVIFDLAGTTVDYGCIAPVAAFVAGFKEFGVTISQQQAREPMGMEKRAHIKTVGLIPEVAEQWQAVHAQGMTDDDIDAMYHAFVPLLMKTLPDYSALVPGTMDCVRYLQQKAIPYAATTGYFREAANCVLDSAEKSGFCPSTSCCATEVRAGRPAPWMIYHCMESLSAFPPSAVVNVGDTKVDVESGRNAGVWSVGVANSGNEMGLSLDEVNKIDRETYAECVQRAQESLKSAGAHYVIDTVAGLPQVIVDIEARIKLGEKPS
ncbi:phosphonoacetaldehyde hydrolase [uncultured Desulfuromusa sp.]|uniref:phosphonoacetaldehyde hydrolase n=1 Tax=uncultured Desulfuromusa sp. TaxID=219183 RepID=UPI002AA8BBE0|nr:phosphonoacetaldehyde hydrolase [uncultured Desulfuromusa sp.]